MKNGKLVAALITAGVVACGAKWAVDEIRKDCDREISDALVTDQLACDVLDGKTLLDWYRAQKKQHAEKTLFFLGWPTQETLDLLGIGSLPAQLDAQHTLFQALISEESATVLQRRMISFSSLSPRVQQGLGNKNYILIEEKE